MAQTNSLWPLDTPAAEKPKTAAEKIEDLQTRHKEAFDKLTANLNRLPNESGFLGSKALFEMVEESTREMKSIRYGCSTLLSSLRVDAKAIKSSSSFSEEQKQELLVSADVLTKDCNLLSEKLDLAIKRLGAAYTIFPKWNRIHKAYRDLQGEAKASEVIKQQVEEYLKSYTVDDESTADDAFEEKSSQHGAEE